MGVGHTDNESEQHFDSEKLKFFLCSGRNSNLCSWNPLDVKADALPLEPPRHLLVLLMIIIAYMYNVPNDAMGAGKMHVTPFPSRSAKHPH